VEPESEFIFEELNPKWEFLVPFMCEIKNGTITELHVFDEK
jgi:hypothetical protein